MKINEKAKKYIKLINLYNISESGLKAELEKAFEAGFQAAIDTLNESKSIIAEDILAELRRIALINKSKESMPGAIPMPAIPMPGAIPMYDGESHV